MAFEITTVVSDTVAEMRLSGRLDANTVARFEQELKALAPARPTRLVLYMGGLSFLASAGIRALTFAKQRLLGPKLTIYVIAPQEGPLGTLRDTGMHRSVIISDVYPPPA
jgi:anti-anti-sigma factor